MNNRSRYAVRKFLCLLLLAVFPAVSYAGLQTAGQAGEWTANRWIELAGRALVPGQNPSAVRAAARTFSEDEIRKLKIVRPSEQKTFLTAFWKAYGSASARNTAAQPSNNLYAGGSENTTKQQADERRYEAWKRAFNEQRQGAMNEAYHHPVYDSNGNVIGYRVRNVATGEYSNVTESGRELPPWQQ
jgi:hypothetical protein